jgi:hypothetical protein
MDDEGALLKKPFTNAALAEEPRVMVELAE